jgi:branched-chain amino acid transport system permease protein
MATPTVIAYSSELIAYRPCAAPRVWCRSSPPSELHSSCNVPGLYGSGFAYPVIKALEDHWSAGPLRILKYQALVIVAAALLMVALYQFTQRTRLGKALRSVSEDKEASALMGIDVDRMISMTFMIGGAAAGAAGVLYAIMFKQVHFSWGSSRASKPSLPRSWVGSAISRAPCWAGFF